MTLKKKEINLKTAHKPLTLYSNGKRGFKSLAEPGFEFNESKIK